jgi:phosphopantothenoylcysteine decarboxylase/phosphopantothenate--cysteine ligase
MADILADRRIVLGVSGSIAAYKALTIARCLTEAGAQVDVILTRAATELVRPLAFQALTHRPVVADLWAPQGTLAMDHVALAHACELLVVAPATANVLAKLALGLADDALSTTALATRSPLVLAPAMEPNMWGHPATQGHAAALTARGAHLVGPELGRMASGLTGEGRMAEPEGIVDHLRWVLASGGPLAGRRVLVTAGPTREELDPVRYLSNHSSGRMGLAIARAARDRGATVTLVLGPVDLPAVAGVTVVPVVTAAEMRDTVLELAPATDLLVMAAAVADYRPADHHDVKLKKGGGELTLRLAPNADILADLDAALTHAPGRPMRVGFAAETHDLVPHARAKLTAKGLDLVVANPVPETFGGDAATVTLVAHDAVTALGALSKAQVAEAILDQAARWLEQHRPAATGYPSAGRVAPARV